MGKAKYTLLVCRIEVAELPDLMNGKSIQHPYEWLKTKWNQVRGMKKATGVKFEGVHPILCGNMEGFCIPDKFSINKKPIAKQEFKCDGRQGCNDPCTVCLQTVYYADGFVEIKTFQNNHGVNFTTTLQKKISKQIWRDVAVYFHLEEKGYHGVTPTEIITYLAKRTAMDPKAMQELPTPKQINNWLENKRKKQKYSHLAKLDCWVSKNPANLVYPKHSLPSEDYSLSGQLIIVTTFGDYMLQRFCSIIKEEKVAALDAQYVNNCLRRPLYIFCTQDPLFFRTIPGFIILLAKNDADHLTKALQIIKSFLQEMMVPVEFPPVVMIDQCAVERAAITAIGARSILCNFHVQRTIIKRIKNLPDDSSKALMTHVKRIQRSTNAKEWESNIVSLTKRCRTIKEKQFLTWFKKFLTEWGEEWSDMGRASLVGIWNTNNVSETFFKQLLRGFLKGISSYSPAEVLEIIQREMIPCLTYKEIQHDKKPSTYNPSFKKLQKFQEVFNYLFQENLITQNSRNLFTVQYKTQTFKVVRDATTKRFACSCGHFKWDGSCLHTFCIKQIHKKDSLFIFESSSDELEEEPEINEFAVRDTSDSLHSSNSGAALELPARKKNVRKGDHLSHALKSAVIQDSLPEKVSVLTGESAQKISGSVSLYKQFDQISHGVSLGKRIPKKKVL